VANAPAVCLTSVGGAASTTKSVIDLTDDDDANAPAAKLLPQTPQLVLIARQPMMSVPALTMASSTAVVKPTMRTVLPPPLQIAPNQQPRLQVLACD